jgi:hypothetical protein
MFAENLTAITENKPMTNCALVLFNTECNWTWHGINTDNMAGRYDPTPEELGNWACQGRVWLEHFGLTDPSTHRHVSWSGQALSATASKWNCIIMSTALSHFCYVRPSLTDFTQQLLLGHSGTPAVYGTWSLTTARYWTLSSIQTTNYFFKIHFNIILPYTFRSSK